MSGSLGLVFTQWFFSVLIPEHPGVFHVICSMSTNRLLKMHELRKLLQHLYVSNASLFISDSTSYGSNSICMWQIALLPWNELDMDGWICFTVSSDNYPFNKNTSISYMNLYEIFFINMNQRIYWVLSNKNHGKPWHIEVYHSHDVNYPLSERIFQMGSLTS